MSDGDGAEDTDRQEELAYGGVCPVCGDEFIDGYDPLDEGKSYDARICVVEKTPESNDGAMLVHLEGDDDG